MLKSSGTLLSPLSNKLDRFHLDYSMIMPRFPNTNIGDSEYPGGMKTYCSPAGRYSSEQGQLPPDFWSNVEFKTGYGPQGGRYAQRESAFNTLGRSAVRPSAGIEADLVTVIGARSDGVYTP